MANSKIESFYDFLIYKKFQFIEKVKNQRTGRPKSISRRDSRSIQKSVEKKKRNHFISNKLSAKDVALCSGIHITL